VLTAPFQICFSCRVGCDKFSVTARKTQFPLLWKPFFHSSFFFFDRYCVLCFFFVIACPVRASLILFFIPPPFSLSDFSFPPRPSACLYFRSWTRCSKPLCFQSSSFPVSLWLVYYICVFLHERKRSLGERPAIFSPTTIFPPLFSSNISLPSPASSSFLVNRGTFFCLTNPNPSLPLQLERSLFPPFLFSILPSTLAQFGSLNASRSFF